MPAVVLWSIATWRCELNPPTTIRLIRQDHVLSEEALPTYRDAHERALILRAAVIDIEAPHGSIEPPSPCAAPTRSRQQSISNRLLERDVI